MSLHAATVTTVTGVGGNTRAVRVRHLAWDRSGVPSFAAKLPWGAAIVGWVALLATTNSKRLAGSGAHGAHVRNALIMTVAMMSIFSIGLCRYVERATFHRQSMRTVSVAYGVYISCWVVASVAIHAGTEAFVATTSTATGVLVASAWCIASQTGRGRDRAMQRCVRSQPIRRATPYRDTTRLAGQVAIACVTVCIPAMVLTALHPTTATVAVVTALIIVERCLPQRPRLALSLAYTVLGAVIVISALMAQTHPSVAMTNEPATTVSPAQQRRPGAAPLLLRLVVP